MKKTALFTFVICLIFTGFCKKADDGIQVVMIDGIKHVMNPAEPLKGTIVLDLEKKLEINPYDYAEVGMRYYLSIKDEKGEVILYDANQAEAHRFSGEGEYLGSMITQGEGPGEFAQMQGMHVNFVDDQIWVTGGRKLAMFDKSGAFLQEFRIDDYNPLFVDTSKYISNITQRHEKGSSKRIVLKEITDPGFVDEVLTFLNAENVGMIEVGNRGFGDDWGVPDIRFAYDPEYKNMFLVYTPDYRITVKDLLGNTLLVIERPYEPINVSRADVKNMLPWVNNERSKWIIDAYPDRLVAIKDLTMLPHGYLAVYRVSGPREAEIDIYDPDGRYVYIMEFPEDMELREPCFYDFGFSNIETKEDIPVYVEYRVKNLPEIFSGNR
jgi:hypothetical protein